MNEHQHDDHTDHSHGTHHGHGNEHDQGLSAVLGHARHAKRMWTSEVNNAVVDDSTEATGLPEKSMHAIMAVNTMHHWVDLDAACTELVGF